jgi:hypothetical protein
MEQVPGMRSVFLNGHALAQISPDTTRYEIPLTDLSDRNQLDIELDMTAALAQAAPSAADWGVISLVIRRAVAHN